MPRVMQLLLFFALLGVGLVVGVPYSTESKLFSVLLSWSVISVMIVYVLPWVYFRLSQPRTRNDE
jgi:ABC-type uncharacterized transport system YnjBCD permease subunit